MLAQVKKLSANGAPRDIAGRFGAWWDGRDYVPPEPEAAPEPEAVERTAKSDGPSAIDQHRTSLTTVELRVKALGAMWGEGRLSPGSRELDSMILDRLFDATDKPGDVGFLGADAMLMNACAARSDRKIRAAEWRAGVAEPLRELAPTVDISASDIDRPKNFGEGDLEAIATIEAFAYSDHKAGLVGRVYRALSDTGRWVFLDTTRTTSRAPAEAFASAWAEPQLAKSDDIEGMLKAAGFKAVQCEPVTPLILEAVRKSFSRVGQTLETVVTTRTQGRDSAIFLQELSWEAVSWRARMRALEGGALEMNLWIADKIVRETSKSGSAADAAAAAKAEADALSAELAEAAEAMRAPRAPTPLGQSDIDSLFD